MTCEWPNYFHILAINEKISCCLIDFANISSVHMTLTIIINDTFSADQIICLWPNHTARSFEFIYNIFLDIVASMTDIICKGDILLKRQQR